MKKQIVKVFGTLMVAAVLFSATACSRTATCDLCGETKKSKFHDATIEGEKLLLCDECYEEIEEIQEQLDELEDGLG